MVGIPDGLVRRSAEAKAKALGLPVEQVLAEMTSESRRLEVLVSDDADADDGAGETGDETTDTTHVEAAVEVGAGSDQTVAMTSLIPWIANRRLPRPVPLVSSSPSYPGKEPEPRLW